MLVLCHGRSPPNYDTNARSRALRSTIRVRFLRGKPSRSEKRRNGTLIGRQNSNFSHAMQHVSPEFPEKKRTGPTARVCEKKSKICQLAGNARPGRFPGALAAGQPQHEGRRGLRKDTLTSWIDYPRRDTSTGRVEHPARLTSHNPSKKTHRAGERGRGRVEQAGCEVACGVVESTE